MEAGNQQQVVRIFVWRLIPSIFLLIRPRPMPRLLFLTGYFSFCCHEEGIPLQAILDNAESPWNLLALGMPYWMGMLYSNQPLWLHISVRPPISFPSSGSTELTSSLPSSFSF